MPTYLVERFIPAGQDLSDAVRRADGLARALDRPGAPVRYLWSARAEEDETWFCCFEAPDVTQVADLNRRAAFPYDRISMVAIVHPASCATPGEHTR